MSLHIVVYAELSYTKKKPTLVSLLFGTAIPTFPNNILYLFLCLFALIFLEIYQLLIQFTPGACAGESSCRCQLKNGFI